MCNCTLTLLPSVSVRSAGYSALHAVYLRCFAPEWLSDNASSPANWSSQVTGSSVFHEVALQNPQSHTESNGRALDGKAYHAMASVRHPHVGCARSTHPVCRFQG